jgi:hypothetical protein
MVATIEELIVDAVNIGEDDAIQGGGCDVSV